LHAKMLLDPVYALRGRRLTDVVDHCPSGEALMLNDVAEHAEGLDVHKGILS